MSHESTASTIGFINLDKKTTRKRSAGKPHAAFDEAGAGNGRYNEPRQFSTLPVRGIEVLHTVKYCGTLDTERQEKQRKQIKPK